MAKKQEIINENNHKVIKDTEMSVSKVDDKYVIYSKTNIEDSQTLSEGEFYQFAMQIIGSDKEIKQIKSNPEGFIKTQEANLKKNLKEQVKKIKQQVEKILDEDNIKFSDEMNEQVKTFVEEINEKYKKKDEEKNEI